MQFTTVDTSPQLVPSKRDPLVPVHSRSVEEREAKRPRTAEVLLEEQLPQSLIDAVELTKETIKAEEEEQLPQGITETEEEKQKHWYVGSIDQGTTSTRFLIFNGHGEPVASHQIEFENHYPHSGWHEHKPMELLESVETCITKATEKFCADGHTVSEIRSIGITNQRETTVLWDKNTGEPLYNAVVWPDTRTAALVRDLKARPGADKLHEKCGLPLSTYPSSVKLLWVLQNVDSVRKAYDEGRLAFGTVDSWLIYQLNGGAQKEGGPVYVTDSTNASRTMFMNLKTLDYDDDLLKFFDIDRNKLGLPKIVPSSHPTAFGTLARGPLKGIPIAGCLGDQSSALVGQCGFSPGQAKNTYGTGCFLLYNVGHEPVISKTGLLATVAYDFGRGRKPVYALEGSIAVAGSGVKFLQNNLGIIKAASEVDSVAQSVPDNGGVVFVTAFSGLFAPYWIDDAKGTLFGVTQHTKKGHIVRATLEATCHQTAAILDAMASDSGHALDILAVDGGLSNSDLCMQTQADLSGVPVDRPAMRETTALGAAIAAGLATGVWNELEELHEVNRKGRKVFKPQLDIKDRSRMRKRWERAVDMSKGWLRDDGDE
ncbi:Glycerol kinase [Fusarium piperis]|uniref:glycerol kinase n=1 Tax=Fusarium piperis TaxID=1435070 RepID=A0A9W8TEV6_9HYPO|nr:Glycerol kinase [Fusarium piperis]